LEDGPEFKVDVIQEEEEEAKKIDPDFKKLIEDAYLYQIIL